MQFEWDPAKDAENRRKHRLSLADGIAALEDPDAESWIDTRFEYGEERIVTLGRNQARILFVLPPSLQPTKPESSPSGGPRNMKNSGTTKVIRNPGSPPVATDTDWAAVDAMSDAEIHQAALADIDAQPFPNHGTAGLTKLVNVKKLRERLGQTQEEFAATYGIPVGTLRDWEQRRKHPDAPARAYLQVIAQNPEAVAALLRSAA